MAPPRMASVTTTTANMEAAVALDHTMAAARVEALATNMGTTRVTMAIGSDKK